VPEIYLELTTPRIITMEYCPSVKISDVEKIEAMGLDRAKLAERSAISYLEQVAKCEGNGEWGIEGGGGERQRGG
jgi:predicted unusual protein kinase regulating ubiquinone biosynthesis (AarF/ABC1/UbiB family)